MASEIFIGAIIIIASILDAIFTLNHLKMGGAEINPIMSWAISKGVVFFLTFKMTSTIVGVGILIWLTQHTRLAYKGMVILAVAYVCLIIYHLFLRNN